MFLVFFIFLPSAMAALFLVVGFPFSWRTMQKHSIEDVKKASQVDFQTENQLQNVVVLRNGSFFFLSSFGRWLIWDTNRGCQLPAPIDDECPRCGVRQATIWRVPAYVFERTQQWWINSELHQELTCDSKLRFNFHNTSNIRQTHW